MKTYLTVLACSFFILLSFLSCNDTNDPRKEDDSSSKSRGIFSLILPEDVKAAKERLRKVDLDSGSIHGVWSNALIDGVLVYTNSVFKKINVLETSTIDESTSTTHKIYTGSFEVLENLLLVDAIWKTNHLFNGVVTNSSNHGVFVESSTKPYVSGSTLHTLVFVQTLGNGLSPESMFEAFKQNVDEDLDGTKVERYLWSQKKIISLNMYQVIEKGLIREKDEDKPYYLEYTRSWGPLDGVADTYYFVDDEGGTNHTRLIDGKVLVQVDLIEGSYTAVNAYQKQ